MSATPICECPCGCSADATGEHRSRGCVRQTCDACADHIDAQDAVCYVERALGEGNAGDIDG